MTSLEAPADTDESLTTSNEFGPKSGIIGIEDEGDGNVSASVPLDEVNSTVVPLHRKLSISEAATASHSGWEAPLVLKWIEYPFLIRDHVEGKTLPETTGWAMDATARAPLNQMGGFVGSAILRLASLNAGCLSVRNCEKTVRGLKPSSLLTLTTAITSIVSALLLPIVGAIVDHTVYRKHIGVITAILCVAFTGIETLISQERNNWFFILIIDSFQTFFLNVHTTSAFAYLPDLTINETVLSHYTSQFAVKQFGFQILYTAMLLVAGSIRGTDHTPLDNSIFTARTAAGMAFGYGFILLGYSWCFLFRERPALSKVPEGQTLINTGFIQVRKTSRTILLKYKALRWFLFSLLWTPEAGAGVILAIAVSFFTVEMNFTSQKLAIITLIFLVGNVGGAFVSKILNEKINPLNTYRSGLLCLAVTIGAAVGVLDSPEKVTAAYVSGALWGVSMGWAYPSQRVLYCTLIPKGQETEMMGIISFNNQILSWLPPLIVTILNENSIELRYGLLVIVAFLVFAVICTLPMGSYSAATKQVAYDSEEKLEEVLLATTGKQPKEGDVHQEEKIKE